MLVGITLPPIYYNQTFEIKKIVGDFNPFDSGKIICAIFSDRKIDEKFNAMTYFKII